MAKPLFTYEIASFPALTGDGLGTRSAWGEAWWTARDVSFCNPIEQPDPIQQITGAA